MDMKRMLNKVGVFFRTLLFPPKCVACREFIQKDIFDLCEVPFCEKCRVKWEYEKLDVCPDCGLEMTVCNCGSRLLNRMRILHCVKLVNYSATQKSVGKSAVLYMKKKKSTRAIKYFAKQLSYAVYRKLKSEESKKAIIAYVPRSSASLVEYGFDQSKELAKRLSKCCDIELVNLFSRSGKRTEEQKKLGISQRIENAKGTYKLNARALKKLDGVDTVFIVDDVLTSGASLAGCILALKDVCDKKVVCVTLARTAKSRKK